MFFIDQQSTSVAQKTVFTCALLFAVLISLNALLGPISFLNHQIVGTLSLNLSVHRWLLTTCLLVYFLRLLVTVWVFQKRKWTWLETIIISVLVPFGLYGLTVWGKDDISPIGVVDVIGIGLYGSGSYLNSQAEFSRYLWKKKKENQGHLYREGLFRYSMHINYFGDILLFFGFALVSKCSSSIIVPIVMTLNFVFNIIPSLDAYLEKKYGSEFHAYEERTKRLIPYIY